MTHWYEEYGDFDEMPEDYPEEFNEKDIEEWNRKLETLEDIDNPKLWWAESIKDIENPQLREKAIDGAQKILDKEKRLNEKLESGEIAKDEFDHEYLIRLGRQKARFSTKCDLGSIGLSYDNLGDVAEDYDLLLKEAAGEPKPAQMKQRFKEAIRDHGPELHDDFSEDQFEEGKISKNTKDTIKRQVRLHGK